MSKRRSAGSSALQSIARTAARSRLGDRLPEDRRPAPDMLISIGLGPPKKEEDDDPDAETHGMAFDDDPVLPGRTRKRPEDEDD